MQMPTPGPDHQRLVALVGEWRGPETMHPGPFGPGGKRVGHSDSRMSGDGLFLITEYRQEGAEGAAFLGHGVIGWDPFGSRYLWYWVDSMGMPPPSASAGKFTGNRLVFESESPHGAMRYTYDLLGPDRYRFTIESSGDGGKTFAPFMEGDYHRVP